MHLSWVSALCALSFGVHSVAAAGWAFEDASVSIQTKGAGVGSGNKHKLTSDSVLPTEIQLGAQDTLKLVITSTNDKTAAQPHQAFLTLHDPASALEESFMIATNEKGKGKLELTQKDLPYQFIDTAKPITARIVIASFSSAAPYNSKVFSLVAARSSASADDVPPAALRYGQLPEIHHTFKADPQSPPIVISGFFTLAVAATLPILFGAWLYLGANMSHATQAMKGSPVSHGLFFGSLIALEGVFFLYYTSWNLFQMLPATAAVGVVAILSGSKALSEVQQRRLAHQR